VSNGHLLGISFRCEGETEREGKIAKFHRVPPISRVFDDHNNEQSLSGKSGCCCGATPTKPFQNHTRSHLRRESDSLVDPGYWKRRQEIDGDRALQIE
jgi:hypothetical protein